MEQHRTRPAQYGPRRGRAPLPPQGRGAGGAAAGRAAVRPGGGPDAGGASRRPATARPAPVRPAPAPRSGPPVARALRALRQMPDPRLTGLGSGLFCAAVMLVLGFLDRLLFGASLTVYGVLFLPVCLLTAVWVRRGDLLTAPVVVPIAFAVGLVTVAEGGQGLGGRLMGLVTALATEAGWLYGGTLVAGATVIVRRIRLLRRRAAARKRQPV
ncbi:putative integral membrane protein [Streptomyces ambofaciens ATCC 23877]|uniref:Putative integral membrane protein n=1 Tax=Streptomyces ambofaciens (strain ATCC 23877 / 3486 / DSM 40053 / JCM 4204 / NBRC 12836 / NRRL B-2516) TaxID=278992 RepID=A0A0K2AY63_STRA7|nr:DUF6542 domain-containing protein [Streptomyces ambofaciens]AKZ57903.1 putative integral membrane protein [Streptomyces ambofaciens ATCC 23877]